MRRLLLIGLVVFSTIPSEATWTFVQAPENTTGGATCAVTTSATGSGNVLVAIGEFGALATMNSSPTNGCSSAWIHCTTCSASNSNLANATDLWYCLNSASGVTSITLNGSTTFDWCTVREYSTNNGPPLFDVGNNRSQMSAVTSAVGVSLTARKGLNDLLVQAYGPNANILSIDSGYGNLKTAVTLRGVADLLNTTNGAAPTWSTDSGQGSLMGIAFKENTPKCLPPFCGILGGGSLEGGL